MSDTVIRVENLSKRYVIGHQRQERYVALRDVIANGARSLKQRIFHPMQKFEDPEHEEFWALKDVSFEIKQGDRVGIIGRNGAGKSTLLKILSRITEPTSGRISIKGRVASLLEVGTGFHPELTGRENIFLNGAILGMGRAEIKKKFDEIVDFAEVEKFLDTPVKHYSSGMYVRLAFAVAAHLEPEILIVDEVLAVGDAAFQSKCLGKIGEFGESGRTVIFVSHNMSAIRRLCDISSLINKGEIQAYGKTSDILSMYLSDPSVGSQIVWEGEQRPGNESTKINAIKLRNYCGKAISSVNISEEAFVEIDFEVLKDLTIQFSIVLMNENDDCIFSSLSNLENNFHNKHFKSGKYKSTCCIYGNLLNAGKLKISLICFTQDWGNGFRLDNCISFDAIDDGILKADYLGNFGGLTRPKLNWQTTHN